jgi:biotin synthase
MSDEMQALCFLAGANSIFYGEKLLTTGNPDVERDRELFTRLGLKPEQRPAENTAGVTTAGARAAEAAAADTAMTALASA